MSNFHTSLFQNSGIMTCLDLIHHNIDISIPFCHHLYLSATFKPCFTWFAGNETSVHTVYRWTQHQIPTCDLIGQWFWCWIDVLQNGRIVIILILLLVRINIQLLQHSLQSPRPPWWLLNYLVLFFNRIFRHSISTLSF
jgi:hypothetical protein